MDVRDDFKNPTDWMAFRGIWDAALSNDAKRGESCFQMLSEQSRFEAYHHLLKMVLDAADKDAMELILSLDWRLDSARKAASISNAMIHACKAGVKGTSLCKRMLEKEMGEEKIWVRLSSKVLASAAAEMNMSMALLLLSEGVQIIPEAFHGAVKNDDGNMLLLFLKAGGVIEFDEHGPLAAPHIVAGDYNCPRTGKILLEMLLKKRDTKKIQEMLVQSCQNGSKELLTHILQTCENLLTNQDVMEGLRSSYVSDMSDDPSCFKLILALAKGRGCLTSEKELSLLAFNLSGEDLYMEKNHLLLDAGMVSGVKDGRGRPFVLAHIEKSEDLDFDFLEKIFKNGEDPKVMNDAEDYLPSGPGMKIKMGMIRAWLEARSLSDCHDPSVRKKKGRI